MGPCLNVGEGRVCQVSGQKDGWKVVRLEAGGLAARAREALGRAQVKMKRYMFFRSDQAGREDGAGGGAGGRGQGEGRRQWTSKRV